MSKVSVRFNNGQDEVIQKLMDKMGLTRSEVIKFCVNYTGISLTKDKGMEIAPKIALAVEDIIKDHYQKKKK